MSSNRVDLVVYFKVVGEVDLMELMEKAYEADDTWPYSQEGEATEPGWFSITLSSLTHDGFDSEVISADPQTEWELASFEFAEHGVTIEPIKKVAMVQWYDAADRPFPEGLYEA